ncbi:hypothetical protein ACFX13_047763 [Malus domestica]
MLKVYVWPFLEREWFWNSVVDACVGMTTYNLKPELQTKKKTLAPSADGDQATSLPFSGFSESNPRHHCRVGVIFSFLVLVCLDSLSTTFPRRGILQEFEVLES